MDHAGRASVPIPKRSGRRMHDHSKLRVDNARQMARPMSASLIGRLRSSAFRLSTAAVYDANRSLEIIIQTYKRAHTADMQRKSENETPAGTKKSCPAPSGPDATPRPPVCL